MTRLTAPRGSHSHRPLEPDRVMPAKGTCTMTRRIPENTRRSSSRILAAVLTITLFAAACGKSETSITLLTHESFALSEDVLDAFTEETGITVKLLTAGDAGAVLNQSILSKGNPLGDVIFGIDNTFMSRALNEDILEVYDSPLLDEIPDEYELDRTNRLLPVDVGDVCINYDIEYFTSRGLAPPQSLADLTKPELAGLLVVENPATSSPGLAFVLATIAEFGTDGVYPWTAFWADLRVNGVKVSPGWSEAYYGDFTWAGGGDRPMVVSYASSPPAEVFFAEPPRDDAPTAVVEASCFRQQEFIGILAGTEHRDEARAFVDFMLGAVAQTDIPWNMFVFPVNENATVPPEFIQFSVIPADPLRVPASDIEAHREAWIETWTDIVVR